MRIRPSQSRRGQAAASPSQPSSSGHSSKQSGQRTCGPAPRSIAVTMSEPYSSPTRSTRWTPPPPSPHTTRRSQGCVATQHRDPGKGSVHSPRPLAASQSWSAPSLPAETMRPPSGLNAQAGTPPSWPRSACSSRPLATSQSLSVWSSPAETTRLPSGLNAQAETPPSWPRRVYSSRPLAASQSLSVSSWLAETTRLPSGLNAQAPKPGRV